MRRIAALIFKSVLYGLIVIVMLATAALSWLRWESHQPRDEWFEARRGAIEHVYRDASEPDDGQLSEFVTLRSNTGLSVAFRVIRMPSDEPLPTLLVLGGHRTGSDAVELFGNVGARAVVALDYPYDGPERVKGLVQTLQAIPAGRRGFLDTVPAVFLTVDWLQRQDWVDPKQLLIVGASLGVPFAATAASLDERISGAVLVHGAADNRLWLERQVERRIDAEFLHYPLGTILYWLAYGPVLDTPRRAARIAPRPVLVIGARDDERTPAGQTEMLFAAIGEPKLLRWTSGRHVQPGRNEVVDELLRIAEEEMPLFR
ncbi:MAG: prolyl oligopeptidase family serine peptidase [Woeseiaceae bacterium]|nr:prolyl oligopeptidase family serine peptidase [Woeseiaceae bacterium]